MESRAESNLRGTSCKRRPTRSGPHTAGSVGVGTPRNVKVVHRLRLSRDLATAPRRAVDSFAVLLLIYHRYNSFLNTSVSFYMTQNTDPEGNHVPSLRENLHNI